MGIFLLELDVMDAMDGVEAKSSYRPDQASAFCGVRSSSLQLLLFLNQSQSSCCSPGYVVHHDRLNLQSVHSARR